VGAAVRLALALPLLLLAGCDGSGPVVAALQGPPRIVWPPDRGVVNESTPTIRWAPVFGAERYEVTILDDAGTREAHTTSTTVFQTTVPLADRQVASARVEAFSIADQPLFSATVTFRCIELPDWLKGSFQITAHDPLLAQGGYKLFNLFNRRPENTERIGALVLVDAHAQVLWWHRTKEPQELADARILDNGNILYLATSPRDDEGRFVWTRAVEMTWDGQVVWQSRPEIMVHHEVGPGPEPDTVLYLTWVYKEIDGKTIEGDGIEIVDRDNNIVWEWNIFDHFDPADRPGPGLDRTFSGLGADWSHANAVVFDAQRSMLWVSVRHFDALVGIDYPSGNVRAVIGAQGLGGKDLMHHQHAVEVQDDSTLLIWDNGNLRDEPISRGAQIAFDEDAQTAEVIWEWTDGLFDFAVGDADRQPNGNVLMTAGVSARIIEVNLAGEVVWELRADPGRWWFYRAEQVAKDMVPASVHPFGAD